MQYIPRTVILLFFLALVIPGKVFGADAVEKAFNLAKELADKRAETGGETQAQPSDPENIGPEQTIYPGITNMRIERGGNGTPSVSIYYPVVGNAAIDANLKKFAEDMADSYEKYLAETYEEVEDKPDSYGNWEETGFFTVERPNPDVISIMFNVYSYTGGAHGGLLIDVQNYDLKSGKRLELKDLFADPDKAIAILSQISALKLRETLGEDAEEEMINEGTAPEPDNFANLSLLPDGVAVEFQPYQVGPWAIGQQHVNVSLEELAPAGPNPSIWPKAASVPTAQ